MREVTLKEDYKFAHDGRNISDHKAGDKIKFEDDIADILVERGTAAEIEEKPVSPIEPEENKLMNPDETKDIEPDSNDAPKEEDKEASIEELREMAKEKGIKGAHNMKKETLLTRLAEDK
jgi:hypothetical protein